MKMRASIQANNGFTLIELAVVLVIIAIMLGSFIGTLSSRIENSRISDTADELEEIKQAMIAFAFVNGYLPCPDCDMVTGNCPAATVADGIADFDAAANRCNEDEATGNVPWVSLGFGRSDSWGTRYRYAVQNEYANSATSFSLDGATGPAGSAIIKEPNFVADATGGTPQDLANNAVAIIFSHGKNGYGGFSENNMARIDVPAANLDESENTNNDNIFYSRPGTAAGATIAGGEFDDIVIWISEYELKAKMVEAGKLP